LVGVNKAAGSRMRLYVKESKIERIVYFDKPAGNMFPDKDVPADQRLLKGFNWRHKSRPVDRGDVFRITEIPVEEAVEKTGNEDLKEEL